MLTSSPLSRASLTSSLDTSLNAPSSFSTSSRAGSLPVLFRRWMRARMGFPHPLFDISLAHVARTLSSNPKERNEHTVRRSHPLYPKRTFSCKLRQRSSVNGVCPINSYSPRYSHWLRPSFTKSTCVGECFRFAVHASPGQTVVSKNSPPCPGLCGPCGFQSRLMHMKLARPCTAIRFLCGRGKVSMGLPPKRRESCSRVTVTERMSSARVIGKGLRASRDTSSRRSSSLSRNSCLISAFGYASGG